MNGWSRRSNGAARSEALVTACPRCGARFDASAFVQEYWTSERRAFSCWCAACGFVCDVIAVDRVLSYEPEH